MSETEKKPVFYSQSGRRWKLFKGVLRLASLLIIIVFVAILIDINSSSDSLLPHLSENEAFRKILNPEHVAILPTTQNRNYKKDRQRLTQIIKASSLQKKNNKPNHLSNIRAGFYVNWDLQAYYSLKENISKLNVVMPEWFFIQDNADTVFQDVDTKALKLMQSYDVKILPIVSNFFNNKWNKNNVERIISNKSKRDIFISNLLSILKRYNFQGVNIDFENLNEQDNVHLMLFQEELYHKLKENGFLVTQDITPFEPSHDLKALMDHNDFLVLMAYDLHYSTSDPGPITDPQWLESILNKATGIVPMNKLIFGLAAYGYDWGTKTEAEDITYKEAIGLAIDNETDITFNVNNYNNSFRYDDETGFYHTVWFTDAAAAFNNMRMAYGYGINNFALWRLGSEDDRIWNFYKRNLSLDSLRKDPVDIKAIEYIPSTNDIDFQGEGEILEIGATPREGKIQIDYDSTDHLITDEKYISDPSSFLIRKFGKAKDNQVLLTFDDGPDRRYTPRILDILKEEHVPAAFFVVGINAENNLQLIKRIYNEGHEIGNHTFLHPNLAEISNERVQFELNATRRLIESVTGHSTFLFRAPYNADSEPENMQEVIPLVQASEHHYITVGESIDPLDWQAGIKADSILPRIISQLKNGSVILLHDAGGDRSATVKALPQILKYFKQNGYQFISIADLLHKKRDDLMPPLKDKDEIYLAKVNWTIAESLYIVERFIYIIFSIAIFLSVVRLIATGVLAYNQRKRKDVKNYNYKPMVSLIIPAYNEEIHAVKNISNLLLSDYSNLELVFVDDGSTDNTYKAVCHALSDNSKIKIFTKPNGGKASALNYGISQSKGEILVCIDADTQLMRNAISNLVASFSNDDVAAVAGNVRVGNEKSLLTKWQSLEYITNQNFDRRAFDYLNCITVVPGAIGAFRKTELLKAGGFSNETLAEDCDITINLLRNQKVVKYADDAIAYTEAPETVKMFVKQRFRWSFGIMQNIWKNRDAFLNKNYKSLGTVAFPALILFQYVLPLFAPFAELLMILGILGRFANEVLFYYLFFIIIDFITAFIALSFEKEKLSKAWVLIPQRFFYRQIMYWVLLKSIIASIKGTLVGWGVLKRTGNAQVRTV